MYAYNWYIKPILMITMWIEVMRLSSDLIYNDIKGASVKDCLIWADHRNNINTLPFVPLGHRTSEPSPGHFRQS